MRFCENIRDLDRAFHPKERGFIDGDEVEMIRDYLEIKYTSNEELRHLRNSCVVYFSHKEKDETGRTTLEDMDKMSGIVCVIDHEKWSRGMEV